MGNPTGIIFVPKGFSKDTYLTDRYNALFDGIKKELGWRIILDNDLDMAIVDTDYLLIFKCPQGGNPEILFYIKDLSKKTKLIGYYSDIHEKRNPKLYHKNMDAILKRCNIILTAYKDPFLNKWKQYKDKAIWFPQFYGPDKRFDDLEYNNKPFNKCLLTGATSPNYYPLRNKIYEARHHMKEIETIAHPGYHMNIKRAIRSGKILRQVYTRTINRYFCSVTTCSTEKYAVAKYFEIPAAGALLLANRCNDVDELGFKDNINYVRINSKNVFLKIRDIVNHPENYEKIRKEGRKFVQKNFSTQARLKQFLKIIEEDFK